MIKMCIRKYLCIVYICTLFNMLAYCRKISKRFQFSRYDTVLKMLNLHCCASRRPHKIKSMSNVFVRVSVYATLFFPESDKFRLSFLLLLSLVRAPREEEKKKKWKKNAQKKSRIVFNSTQIHYLAPSWNNNESSPQYNQHVSHIQLERAPNIHRTHMYCTVYICMYACQRFNAESFKFLFCKRFGCMSSITIKLTCWFIVIDLYATTSRDKKNEHFT